MGCGWGRKGFVRVMFGSGSLGLRRGLFVIESKTARQCKNLMAFIQKCGLL